MEKPLSRKEATDYCRQMLTQYALVDWKIKLVTPQIKGQSFLGKCDYKEKTIYLNAHHIDTHPPIEVRDTILHEVAHALVPGDNHGAKWRAKALEIGCSGLACATYSLSPAAIDAIRSGDILEVDYVEVIKKVMVEEEQKVREPKYKVTRFIDKCEVCDAVAKEKSSVEFRSGKVLCKKIELECGHIRIVENDSQSPFDLMVSNFWKEHVVNCKHIWDKNKCIICDEFRLFPFQIEGARSIERNNGRFAVFDQQGLGKTVQALAYLKYNPKVLPCLFIVKSKLKYQWMMEIMRWCGESYFPQVISDSKKGFMPGLKCYITSFDLLRRIPKERFDKLGIKCAVIDEVQAIKNPDSTRTREVRSLLRDVPHIIPLSGTPWKNRGSEFFVVLNMLDPVKFHSYQHFLDTWVDYYMHGNRTKMGGIRRIKEFHEATKHILIRREREEVMPELPKVNRTKFVCEIENDARKAYDEEVSDFVRWYNELVISGEEDNAENSQTAIAKLQRMRHILGLAKIPAAVELAEEFLEETGRHLVIGVHHKDVGQLMMRELSNLEYVKDGNCKVLALTAGLNDLDNQRIKMEFINSKQAVLVASTLSAGEGTDGLQKVCCDMFIHERQWNPMNEEQLEDRLCRIGQDAQKVNATYIHADNSTDTQLDGIIETKRRFYHVAMNKGEMPQWQEVDIISELIKAVVNSAKTKAKSA